MHPALTVTDLTDDELEDLLAQLEAERRRRWALRRQRHRACDMVERASGKNAGASFGGLARPATQMRWDEGVQAPG